MAPKLTADQATEILTIAQQGSMFNEGKIPDSDADRISEATKLIELAEQSHKVALHIGVENVANYADVEKMLVVAGVDVGTTSSAPASPSVTPEATAAVTPEPIADAPAGDGTIQAQAGEHWLDAEGNEWMIHRYDGGPQMEAMLASTGEVTTIPTGFLKQRVQTKDPAAAFTFTPGEQRVYPGDNTVYTIESYDEDTATIFMLNHAGERMQIDLGAWLTWTLQSPPQPDPVPAVQPDPIPEPGPEVPPDTTSSPVDDLPAPPEVDLVPGEHRLDGYRNTYVLKAEEGDNVRITDITGEVEHSLARTQWISYPLIEGVSRLVQKPDPQPVTPPQAEPARHEAQSLAIPDVDDEGDDEYADLLAKVGENYSPSGMPAPMDLSHDPTPLNDDATKISDMEARRLHSERNALASRARYLHGLEAARARACERLYKHHLKGAMREARAELGKDVSVTEVQHQAEDNETVANWMRRRDVHADAADAYKTFLSIYTEDVTVLSRDWTMRAREEDGS